MHLPRLFKKFLETGAGGKRDGSPSGSVGKYCQQLNKVKWCVGNEMGKVEIKIVTGMKGHLMDEYLKIMEVHNATFPP